MGHRPPKVADWLPDESTIEGMRAMNAKEWQIAAVQAQIDRQRAVLSADSENFPVWRCNWPVVVSFLRLSTQWMRAGIGGQITGLHYGNVLAWLEHRYPSRRQRRMVFEGIQIMERAALDGLAELPKDPPTKQ